MQTMSQVIHSAICPFSQAARTPVGLLQEREGATLLAKFLLWDQRKVERKERIDIMVAPLAIAGWHAGLVRRFLHSFLFESEKSL